MSDDPRDERRAAKEAAAAALLALEQTVVAAQAALDQAYAAEAEGRALLARYQTDEEEEVRRVAEGLARKALGRPYTDLPRSAQIAADEMAKFIIEATKKKED